MLDTFSYFLRYYAHFKFDMAPLFVLLKGNQLLTIWVQIHPDQKVGYLVKSRSNLVIFRKSDWKYLILMRNDEFWCWSEFFYFFWPSVNSIKVWLSKGILVILNLDTLVHSTFDYDKLHLIQHSFNLGIIIIIFAIFSI